MKPNIKKNIYTLFTILLLDVVVIGCWTLYFKPSSDMTIILIFIIPAVFVVNLIVGCFIFFIKRYYTSFFIINAFVAPFILYLFFGLYIRIHSIIYWESWEFYIGEKKYSISYSSDKEYNITYSFEPGSSWGDENDRGIVIERNDTVFFMTVDSSMYFIYKNYLYNFEGRQKIKVEKID